jgi:hypothetical protein
MTAPPIELLQLAVKGTDAMVVRDEYWRMVGAFPKFNGYNSQIQAV